MLIWKNTYNYDFDYGNTDICLSNIEKYMNNYYINIKNPNNEVVDNNYKNALIKNQIGSGVSNIYLKKYLKYKKKYILAKMIKTNYHEDMLSNLKIK